LSCPQNGKAGGWFVLGVTMTKLEWLKTFFITVYGVPIMLFANAIDPPVDLKLVAQIEYELVDGRVRKRWRLVRENETRSAEGERR
jgi:hypothetical protein